MSLKYTVVLVWAIYLSYKMVLTSCEVVWVDRHVVDNFHVGKYGCTYYSSVCTNSHATCRKSDGLCLCGILKPNYINPTTRTGDDKSHGCVNSYSIRAGLAGVPKNCALGPFQFIPYKKNEPARKFFDKDNPTVVMKSCSLRKVLVKFPDKAGEMELQWLDESYVDLNVSNNDLYFKWKKSVPNLQGTIITFSLRCVVKNENARRTTYQITCLRAKVLGTWSAAEPTVTSPKSNSSQITTKSTLSASTEPTEVPVLVAATSGQPKSPQTITKLTSSVTATIAEPTRSSSPGKGSSSDGDSSGAIISIAVMVPVVLLGVLVVLVWLLCKRKKRNSLRKHSSRGSSCEENINSGSMSMKQFSYTESNIRASDAYEEVRVTNKTFAAYPVYTITPGNRRVLVEDNDPQPRAYAMPYNDPACATPDNQRVMLEANDSHVYATPDDDPAYATPANDPACATPDNQRVMVEANYPYVYATPDNDPAYATPDNQSVMVEANDHACLYQRQIASA